MGRGYKHLSSHPCVISTRAWQSWEGHHRTENQRTQFPASDWPNKMFSFYREGGFLSLNFFHFEIEDNNLKPDPWGLMYIIGIAYSSIICHKSVQEIKPQYDGLHLRGLLIGGCG